MGFVLNSNFSNDFVNLAKYRHSDLFVDKTGFLEKINERFGTENRFITVTRGRRFGKTVTAKMLAAYYSKAYAGQNIFDELKISKKKSYSEHLNKYDVIFVDMITVDGLYSGYKRHATKVPGIGSLADYFEYYVIKELRRREDIAECFNKHQIGSIGLLEAFSCLRRELNVKFVFILDEWDLVYRDFRDDIRLHDEFSALLRKLFESEEGRACFELVYFTGILPIPKKDSKPVLGGFDEYNMLRPGQFGEFFGFADDEIAEIAQMPYCRVSYQDIKNFYRGYRINGVDVYNPNSVSRAVWDSSCDFYWMGTSSNEEFKRLINLDYGDLKQDVMDLLEGGEVPFSCETFQNHIDSVKNKDDVFSLLVCLGYLGCAETQNPLCKIAYVPNKEIISPLRSIVSFEKWFKETENVIRSENLLKAILELDSATAEALLLDARHSKAGSHLDLGEAESVADCVKLGLLWSTRKDYPKRGVRLPGIGGADLLFEPFYIRNPVIVFGCTYDGSAEESVARIKSYECLERYKPGYWSIDVIAVGINYSSDAKKFRCIIEKLDLDKMFGS